MNQKVFEKIRQRRLQILVHSCIYYEYDDNIVTDSKWNSWAKELVELQGQYPEEAKEAPWEEAFREFDGSTGMDLPLKDFWVYNKAGLLLYARNKGIDKSPVITKTKTSQKRRMKGRLF